MECIPGRPGCVLAGKVKLSEYIKERLQDTEENKPLHRRDGHGKRFEEGQGRRRRSGY